VSGHNHAAEIGGRRRALLASLVLTASFTVLEVVAGLLTHSLALLADAGHMVTDVASMGMALGAFWLAGQPATRIHSFGFKRAEVLSALANGVTLVAVAIWIIIEAARRFSAPAHILGGWMLVVAAVGLVVNSVVALILLAPRRGNLNLEAAFRHVLGDLAGAAGTVVAAIVIFTTGWLYADPLASVLIALLILASSWSVLRESVHILMEGAPQGIDVGAVETRMLALPGVLGTHDLHLWTITSGFPALSAHLLVSDPSRGVQARCEAERLLHDEFGIEHVTLQVEIEGTDPECELIDCCGR
jgi:cobalt-zinc-cadmium efflux system protein